MAEMTKERIDEMLEMRRQGVLVKDIKTRFGISEGTYYNILKRQHIGGNGMPKLKRRTKPIPDGNFAEVAETEKVRVQACQIELLHKENARLARNLQKLETHIAKLFIKGILEEGGD